MDGRNGASSPAPQIRFGPPGGVNPTFFAPSLAEGPRRRHHLSSDCGCGGGRTVPNQKFLSMDDLLECKRQIEKSNAAGTSRDEDKQERLVQEIEVLMEDDKKSDQAQQFMVAIPSFISFLVGDRRRSGAHVGEDPPATAVLGYIHLCTCCAKRMDTTKFMQKQ
ncbi:uncharacterized protein LOC107305020 isoform X2 [Oryza brachyantha]|uniref:uncharacterized protein LOC107305020 isoform X2 n=1 Tax=Oryza brachyantha TaxID=4533 RepID=UPI000776404E|nr:uncharacterized protein LOC107305020 isoform X2 [Oryza brachyantha]